MKINFITGNEHKYLEIKNLIETKFPNISIIQAPLPLKELQADTLEEVAKFKIQSIHRQLKPPYIIEDAGFFVDDVCDGFPGVYSSYVMKTIGYNGILKIMGKSEDRKAHFESVIAYYDENETVSLFKGRVDGKVSMKARGKSGFGFDPIFIPNEIPEKTFAEISREEKNTISHRSRAFEKFMDQLK